MNRIFAVSLVFLLCKQLTTRFEESPINPHGFSNAIHPVQFTVGKDYPINLNTGSRIESSYDCRTCHENIYENWSKSRHKVAYSNPLYQVSHKKEPMAWCLNCHSPLMEPRNDPKDFLGRFQSEDGVSCITCHVRDSKILTTEIPKVSRGIHSYVEVPQMKESEFCGNCHQFNFPTIESLSEKKPLEYSHLPMQNTLQEWKESPYYPKKNCQSCHVFPRQQRSHLFSGGHDAEYLRDSFRMELEHRDGDDFIIVMHGIDIGHHFPTGDLFRSLRLRIKTKSGRFVQEFILRKEYSPSLTGVNPTESPARVLSADSSLNEFSQETRNLLKKIPFHYAGIERELIYELEMDYQSGENHFFNQLPYKETFRKFLKGEWILPDKEDIKG